MLAKAIEAAKEEKAKEEEAKAAEEGRATGS